MAADAPTGEAGTRGRLPRPGRRRRRAARAARARTPRGSPRGWRGGQRRGRTPAAAEPQERTARFSGARVRAACVPGAARRARCRAPAGQSEGYGSTAADWHDRSPPAPAARCGRGGPTRISGTFRGTESAFRVPGAGRARGATPAVEHGRAANAAGASRAPAAARHFEAFRRPSITPASYAAVNAARIHQTAQSWKSSRSL
ncbi:hypothetical protein K562_40079 (plasmid) [Burkholderia cenocepacia]|nr:hypothetical protein K562_40079 [Burkholderia cenocepacia]